MAWFTFNQNNSGGSFDVDEDAGIGQVVFIEANDWRHACDRAESIGIYFNGVEDGLDCECCGDRWYSPQETGDTPKLYGEEFVRGSAHVKHGWFNTHTFAHPLNGKFYVAVPAASNGAVLEA